MPWRYSQKTGDLHYGEIYEGRGYSGHGVGVNEPLFESTARIGPIPRGAWIIGTPRTDAHLGPLAFPLTPVQGTEAFGRSGFYIHGDNSRMNETGSEGCIVLGHSVRVAIASALVQGGDHRLEVIP